MLVFLFLLKIIVFVNRHKLSFFIFLWGYFLVAHCCLKINRDFTPYVFEIFFRITLQGVIACWVYNLVDEIFQNATQEINVFVELTTKCNKKTAPKKNIKKAISINCPIDTNNNFHIFAKKLDRYCYVNKKDQQATIKTSTFISTTYVLCMIAERRQVFLSIAIQKVIHVSFGRQQILNSFCLRLMYICSISFIIKGEEICY